VIPPQEEKKSFVLCFSLLSSSSKITSPPDTVRRRSRFNLANSSNSLLEDLDLEENIQENISITRRNIMMNMMKGKGGDVLYSSLDNEPDSPLSNAGLRCTDGISSHQISINGSSSIGPSDATRVFFGDDARVYSPSQENYRTAVHDILKALTVPLKELTLEVKGALLATGYVNE
jgi:hypothetical protein